MDHNLNGLTSRDFEHLSEAMAQAVLGPGVSAFGDGKDGGREATFEGRVPYSNELQPWEGYGVVQAKFRQRPDQPPVPVSWFKDQVRDELEAWLAPKSKRGRLPQYVIFTTNVVLSAVPESGGIAQVDGLIATYADRLQLKGWAVWHYDQLCRYLDQHDGIRRTYAHSVTAGDVLSRLFDALPAPAMTRAAALQAAARACHVRRTVRLRPVPDERVTAVLEWIDRSAEAPVQVSFGQVGVLVAPMGAGKSERAERWWSEGLAEAAADASVPIPLWLEARTVGPDLRARVAREIDSGPPTGPCRVVVDNLDGVSPQQALQLLEDAIVMVRTWPSMRILATCRPGIDLTDAVVHRITPWEPAHGRELVRLVAGSQALGSVEEPEVQDLLTSPLQALAVAGRLLAGQEARVSNLELMSGLAANILQRRRPARATEQTWDSLARLAERILDSQAPVPARRFGREPEVWDLTDTGLVVDDEEGLRFALPVFEHHFGAQALRRNPAQLEAVAGTDAFPRWRYAIAFAIDASEPDQAEDAMLRLARTNPAAASWVLDELARPRQPGTAVRLGDAVEAAKEAIAALGPAADDDPQSAQLVGEWLREATCSWAHGMGPLAQSLAAHHDGRLARWGVKVDAGMVTIAPSLHSSQPPEVVPLYVHPARHDDPQWRWSTQYVFPADRLGRWRWSRERLRTPLQELIRKGTLSVPVDSPLAAERLWFLAQCLAASRRDPHLATISLPELRDRVEQMMEDVRRTASLRWHQGGYHGDADDIRWLHTQIAQTTGEVLQRPYPVPDRQAPWSRYAWQEYSPELTLAIAQDMMRAAVIGYRHLVENNFPTFGPALGLYGALPVRVEGQVVIPHDDTQGHWSGLLYTLRPDAKSSKEAPPTIDLTLYTESGFGPTTSFPTTPVQARSPFHKPVSEMRALNTQDPRQATALSYAWLIRDLKAVGWLTPSATFS